MKRPETNRSLAATACLVLSLWASQIQAYPVDTLRPVGSTTLKWMFFTVYDSALFSPDGIFRGIEPGLALRIDYHRAISRDRLLQTTRDQWRKLGLYQGARSESWLVQLQALWPDVSKGDSIAVYVEPDGTASFYYNQELAGVLADPDFARHFLAIWLAENSSFPALRDQLVGGR